MRCVALSFFLISSCFADLYFMIEKAKVFQCGGTNAIELKEKDIRATDSQGREVHYFKAPGEVVVTFRNIRVRQPMKNLAGDLSVNLQVPLGDSPLGFRWDIPYSAVPQKKLIGGYTCDEQSGYIKEGNRNICRYCNLCMTTATVEQKLSTNQRFLPNLGRNEEKFSRICGNIKPTVYQMTRTIKLPSKEELKRLVEEKSSKIENTLKNKLNIGVSEDAYELTFAS
ncbi:unnamed protein product [Soboliphyme baturini]|uniref:Vitellogenin domain-containing protein n=1 Tax=Soboliphyme baturini TaxID=241478 RepID=A0A183IET3_9BILA|nr:unnamed protein product [Soboliphyme baturini]